MAKVVDGDHALGRVPTIDDIARVAQGAGIRRVHMLAWRDLEDPEAGGSETHASTVADLWTQAGLKVMMRSSHAVGLPKEAVRDGYEVIRRGGRMTAFPRAVLAEMAKLHGSRDALVEIWNGVPFFSPIWARGPNSIWIHHPHTEMWPLVLTKRLALFGRLLERRIAPVFYRRSQVVALGEVNKKRLVDEFGLRPANVHVIPPGVDGFFGVGGKKTTQPSVLSVGRLSAPKAFGDLISAMHEVRKKVPATLTIIGEGVTRHELEAQIETLGARGWCEMLGRVDRPTLLRHYQQSWVLTAASRSEGWNMTITEAAACGTPVVATKISGHQDSVVEGQTGILANKEREFAASLARILTDNDLRERLGKQASLRASKLLWERTAYETMEVLAKSAKRRRHAR